MQASTTCTCLYVLFISMFKSKSGQHILTLRSAAFSVRSDQSIKKPNQQEVQLKIKIGAENYKRVGPLACMYLVKTLFSIIHTDR